MCRIKSDYDLAVDFDWVFWGGVIPKDAVAGEGWTPIWVGPSHQSVYLRSRHATINAIDSRPFVDKYPNFVLFVVAVIVGWFFF